MRKNIHHIALLEQSEGFLLQRHTQPGYPEPRLQRSAHIKPGLLKIMVLMLVILLHHPIGVLAQLKVPAIPSNEQFSSQFEYSSEIAYRVNLEGNYLEDGTIVAYVNGHIRGAQSASVLFPPTGAYSYKVRVFSNDPTGETITFRYYDVFDEKIYDIVEQEPFVADQVPDFYNPTVLNAVCGEPGVATGLLPVDQSAGQEASLNLFWQPAGNALYYRLYLWKEGDPEPATPYRNNISGTSTWASNLTYGATYHWYIESVNQCLQDTSVHQEFTVRNLPDLTIRAVEATDTMFSSTAFDISYTISNHGAGGTSAKTWYDAFYLSSDNSFEWSDLYLGQVLRKQPLDPGSSYTHSITVTLPAETAGNYFIFGVTDRSNSIAETDNANNILQQGAGIHVLAKPLPDVRVANISADRVMYDPGDTIMVSWNVANIGDADASGGWTEKVSVVSLSGIRVELSGTPQYTGDLAMGDDLDRSHSFVLPEVISFAGEAYVEVELVPSDLLEEYPGDEVNNHASSQTRINVRNTLYLVIPAEASEAYTGNLRSYVTRSGNTTQELTVNLTSSETGQINLPASVTIPQRSSSAVFNITMVDNSDLDGTRPVEVTAAASGYDARTARMQILDNEKPSLALTLDKDNAAEGDTLQLSITRDLVTTDSVAVLLSTGKSRQWSFPAQVVLPGNQASVTAKVAVTDDVVPELDEQATISASASGMIAGSVAATIIDDDIPQIGFSITADSVSEGAGPYATFAKITRTGNTEGTIRVSLTADQADALYFPTSVSLNEGVVEKQINIGAVDNGQVDGARTIVVTAAVYISSCNCNTSEENGGVVTDSLIILDNDGPSLGITVNPVSLREGVANAGTMTITRNTATTSSLNLELTSGDVTELTIPATATIPAGSAGVDVVITTIDDQEDDGNQMVTLQAKSDGFSSGVAWVNVTDINRPDLEMEAPEISGGSPVVTGQQMEVRSLIHNNGYGKAPTGVSIKFFLSENDRLDDQDEVVYEGELDEPVAIGGSYQFADLVKVPRMTGDYYLFGKINPDTEVTELLYTNNASPAVALTIEPNYSGTAVVDEESFTAPVPVTIHGSATLINGDPAADAGLDVYVISGGSRRVIEVTTDANGDFSTVFEPFAYESGHYIVGACYPGQGLTDEQDAFDIMGMERAEKGYLTWNLKKNVPVTGTIGIRNRSNVPLSGITFAPREVPEGMVLQIDTIPLLEGNEVEQFNFTIYGEVITEGKNYVEVPVTVRSAEGISFTFKAWYYCQALEGHLVSEPKSINTTITKDKLRYYDIMIVNDGAGETGKVSVALPDQDWMSVASADTIDNMASGDTAIFTLLFDPGSDIPLNTPLSGRIVAHHENGDDLSIPYRVEVVSEETGALSVDVVDEYTYFTEDAPHVQNAHVVVRHPYTGRIVAEGFTGPDGIFEVDSLNEGSYKMTVQADKHEGYQNVIVIDPGRVNEQTVFLSFQAITYTWEVVPTEIEDEYEIELVMEYETNVPAPVVVMEMPDVMPQLFNDETYTFMLTLTNKGLITALDVELNFPQDDPEYEWVTAYQTMDLLAQQAIQVPVTMRRKAAFGKSGGGAKSDGPCSDYAMTFYGFECASDRQWKQTNALFTISGRTCPGGGSGGGDGWVPTGGGGGPGSPGGGGTTTYDPYGGSASTVSPITGCDPCLNSVLITIIGCVGPGAASNVLGCGYGFADGDASWSDIGGCIPGPIGCAVGIIGTIETCYNTPPFGMGGGASGGKKALDELLAKGTTVPPIIYQSALELDYALYNDQAERDYVSEYMGSVDWTVKENFPDFTVATDSVVTNQVPFDQATIDRVKQYMEGTDFTNEEIDAFAARWNMTMEAWGQGIFVPTAQYPDIINRDSLDSYFAKMQEARDYALSLGYTSVSEMKYIAWHTMKEEAEDKRSSVCASVSIKISQKLVMTREAFEGTLTIFNGNTTTAMEEIELNLEVRNPDGELANDLFEIETKALDILTGIDGTGSLGAEQTGSATILFIPEKGAAPEVPVSYSFGGSFSYLDPFTGVKVEKPLFPVTLDVNPSPDLFLHYFMQRDILGDDPLTDPIEPIIPGELAVMIENNGFGTAKNVRIESAQPEIIDNEKGLAIHFELIGSNLNGQPAQLGLTDIDFGNIAPKSTKIGQWWFTADLLGHFVNYEANVTHLDSRGNPDLSLVSGAELHELIRSIRVYGATDDGINDFLVNAYQDAGEVPDVIYLSQGQQLLDVHEADVGLFEGEIRAPSFTNTLRVVNSRLGWNYIRLPDPGDGKYELVSITRIFDNQEIPMDNAWLTHVTLPDGNEPVYENKFHMVDMFEDIGDQEYHVTWELKDPDPPTIVSIDGAPDAFVSQPVTTVYVKFNKEIDPATFTWEDMMLRLQGGDDIMDSTVTITQLDPLNYQVDISQLTTGNGFYALTVQAAEIMDLDGTNGLTGKQVVWTQFLNVPMVDEFIGVPGADTSGVFDNILVRFNLPMDVNTILPSRFILSRDGTPLGGSLNVTLMDTDAQLFSISGLEEMMTEDGRYTFTVDLPNLATIDGEQGLLQQQVGWTLDREPPVLLSFHPGTSGGFDAQHVTSMEVLFSEPVGGFGLAAVELWMDGAEQPLSQVHFDSLGNNRYRMTQFRLLTYYSGEYTLRVHMDNLADGTGNSGTGTEVYNWTVDRNPPAQVENLRISPDLGYSDTDGITSTRNVQVLMDLLEDEVTVELFENDFGTLTMLADSSMVNAGPLSFPVRFTTAGNINLEVHVTDKNDNSSVTKLPVVVDESALRMEYRDIPEAPVGGHPDLVTMVFSDPILLSTLAMDNISLSTKGNAYDLAGVVLQQESDTTFSIRGLNTITAVPGEFTLSVDLRGIEKYRSGSRGTYTATASWTILIANEAPVADAGKDFNIETGEAYQLDASGSFDPDNDQLTYAWFPPEGFILDDPFSMTPTFTAIEAPDSTEFTFLLSVSDGLETSTDRVVALLRTGGGGGGTGLSEEAGGAAFRIYPNPARDYFFVEVQDVQVKLYELYDLNGKLLIQRKPESGNRELFETDDMDPGVYVLRILTDGERMTGRIIVF
ncbi:MAG: CARDB domain-containing protein [Bacteroidales bacterium]|nr:CARDB domain-containing protein [Bacteroidales bacterium]